MSTLADALRLGPVHLTVRDLRRSLEWYREALGLHGRESKAGLVELGDGAEPVVVLHENPEAEPAGRHAGLFHYALLYPSREELALAAFRLLAAKTPVSGMSDHGTHEAIYLRDPDGNGIELAADRPREVWPDPREEMYRESQPLDVPSLLGAAPTRVPPSHVGEDLRIGHVHLHVGDVEQGLAFYRDVMGFDEMVNLGTAAFISVGGYHHHLAFNVWHGIGVPPAPEHRAGLVRWTIELPQASDVDAVRERLEAVGRKTTTLPDGFTVRDPWEIALSVVSNGSAS